MSTGSIQLVNLADNVNAAFDKINENFELIETGAFGGSGLDSSNVINVVNQEYLSQFTFSTEVDLTDLENAVAANAASLLTLHASITETDSGITVLATQQAETQAQLEGLVLGGIDSDLLADAIANSNTTLTSRIDATDSSISVFAANIDSVNANLLLRDSATNDRIDIQTNAVNALTATVTANSNGLSAVVSDVSDLDISLNQIISDGITLTPEQVTEAIGGALDELTLRLNADSDKLVLEAAKIVDLDTLLEVIDSDTGAAITAEGSARSALTSRVEVNEGNISSVQEDITTLNSTVYTTDSNGQPISAVANATNLLQSSIDIVNGRIYSADAALKTELESKIGTDIATASQSLQTQIDGLGGTTATWNLDLVAGTESNPHIAGIKFGNDGATAEFALTADTFRIVNASNNEIQPFTVSGNEVQLSNATVTGNLNIGSNLSGEHTEITDDVIKVFDTNGFLRVKLGNLGA
jgi:hypothetical protein